MNAVLREKNKNERGFIALISAVIISAIMIGLAATLGMSALYARFDVLTSEYKRISLGLAESCVHEALLKIAQDFSYDPGVSGKIIPVGGMNCSINSVMYVVDLPGHRKIATITAQAEYHGAFSNVRISAYILDPHFAVADPSTPQITINSWQEVPR